MTLSLSLKAETTMTITEADRMAIEQSMSEAMGSYIEKLGKLDFSTWTPDEWERFVATAFDVSAPQVFCKRIHVSPPFTIDEIPY